MAAIGERLREARMRQGVDISEVEQATKIRAKYLRALENDDFSMLPGGTYIKSFLRTYAEYLGLDAQLLVEEFRAQHEPRGESELQTLAPATTPRVGRERREGPPPIGPGTIAVVGILAILVVLAVIGLATGGGGSSNKTAKHAKKKAGHHKHKAPAPAAPPKPRSVKLKVVPSELTYVCVDGGALGKRVFEGTITSPHTFKDRKKLFLNLGRSSATLIVNGKPFKFQQSSSAVGFSFSRSGHGAPLPPGQRPCA